MTKFMFCAKVLLKFSVHQYGHSVRMQFEKYKDMFNRTNQGHEYKLFTFQKHNRANKYTAILHAPMGRAHRENSKWTKQDNGTKRVYMELPHYIYTGYYQIMAKVLNQYIKF